MKERNKMRLTDTELGHSDIAVKTAAKRFGWKKLARRAAAGLLAMSMIMTTALANVGVTARAEEAKGNPEQAGTPPTDNNDTRKSDTATWDTWKEFLDMETSSKNAGRVWTDKSVFGQNASSETGIDVGDNEFVEVFSAMGSSQEYEGDIPVKMVFVIDNSATMYYDEKWSKWEDTRMAKITNTINTAIDKLMRENTKNEVAVVLFGDGSVSGDEVKNTDNIITKSYNGNSTAKVIIPMGRYQVGNEKTVLDYVMATWTPDDGLADGENLEHSKKTNGGYLLVNHNALGNKEEYSCDYTAYKNGTTNIQAGIYVGMRQLLDTPAMAEINGISVEYNPSMVVLTDGASTDMISLGKGGYNDWFDIDAETIESYGFVNDPGSKFRSFTGYNSEHLTDWNMFIQKNTTDSTDVWEVIGGANDGTSSNPPRDSSNQNSNLNQLAADYRYTVEYMLLGTLVTAGYMKAKVNQKYGERRNCHIYTISLDMGDPSDSSYKSKEDSQGLYSAPMMNPAECFNTDWIKGHNTLFLDIDKSGLTSTVSGINPLIGTIGYESVQGMLDAVTAWENRSMPEGSYMAWEEHKNVVKNEGTIRDYTKSPSHSNFYVVERTDSNSMDLEKTDVSYDINYVDNAYYVNTIEGAENSVAKTFNEIVQKEINQAFNPVSPLGDGTDADSDDGYLVYTDPIGAYMKVNSVVKLQLFGKTYQLSLSDTTMEGEVKKETYKLVTDETSVNNPCYGMDGNKRVTFNPSQISVIVETQNGPSAENVRDSIPWQTLKIRIPGAALPLMLAHITYKIKDNATTYRTNKEVVEPLRLFYTVGMIDEVMTGGAVDPGKVSDAYAGKNTDEDGNIQFYTNLYTGEEDEPGKGNATTEFVPNDSNRYYLTQPDPNKSPADNMREVYDRWFEYDPDQQKVTDHTVNGSTYDPEERDTDWKESETEKPRPKKKGEGTEENPTGTAVNSYEPGKKDDKVQAFLGNNGRLSVQPAELLLTKEVSNETNRTKEFKFLLRLEKTDAAGKTVNYMTDLKAQMGTYSGEEGNMTFTPNPEGNLETISYSTVASFERPENNPSSDSGYHITLNAGEGLKFTKLPSGYICTVTEILDNGESGTVYKAESIEVTGGEGEEKTVSNLQSADGVLLGGSKNILKIHYTNKKYYKDSLTGTKKITVLGENGMETEVSDDRIPSVFRFRIDPDNNPNPDPVINTADNTNAGDNYKIVTNDHNNITFYKDAEFEWGQTYTYTIYEVDDLDIGYEMDRTKYKVVINLTDTTKDEPTITVTADNSDPEDSGGSSGTAQIIFKNRKIPGADVTIYGLKRLVSVDDNGDPIVDEWFEPGAFEFEITGVSFEKISVASPAQASINYTSLELSQENSSSPKVYSLATDNNAAEVRSVRLATPGDAENYGQEELVKGYTVEEIRALVEMTAGDVVKNWPTSSADGVPLPNQTTVGNDDRGYFAFGSITFENPGVYKYAIREVDPGDHSERLTYDDEIYTVVVVVEKTTASEDGTEGGESGSGAEGTPELKVTQVVIKNREGVDVGTYFTGAGMITLYRGTKASFVNKIKKPKVSVKVKKKWVDFEELKTRPDTVYVNLLRAAKKADGTEPELETERDAYTLYDNVTLNEANDWTYAWEDLDKCVGYTNVEYVYTVEEGVNVPGYTAEIKSTSDNHEDGTPYDFAYTITNTYTEKRVPKIKIQINKEWLDHGGQDSERVLEIKLHQKKTKDGELVKTWTYELNRDTVENYGSDNWIFKCWSSEDGDPKDYEFDKYWWDENKKVYTEYFYEAVETSCPEGYEPQTHGRLELRRDGVVTGFVFRFTNSYDPLVDITVKKLWEGDEGLESLVRPDSIRVQLYRTVDGSSRENVGKPVDLTSENWSYTWKNLPKYPGNNSKTRYTYGVEELDVPEWYTAKYITSATEDHQIDANDQYSFTITNVYQPEYVSLTVNKVWANDEGWEDLRPEEIEVTLLQNGRKFDGITIPSVSGEASVISTKTLTKNSDGTWSSVTWQNLPKWEYSKVGGAVTRKAYNYTVEEKLDGDTYYDAAVSGIEWNGNSGTITITNTLRTAMIRVAKWIDNHKAADDLMEDEFIIEVEGDNVDFYTGLRLQHAAENQNAEELLQSKYSGYLKVPVPATGTTELYIRETAVPKEYETDEVYYTYATGTDPNVKQADGSIPQGAGLKSEDGRYKIEISAEKIKPNPDTGEVPEIVVVVHNKFEHDWYFHSDSSVDNDFDPEAESNQNHDSDGYTRHLPNGSADDNPVPTPTAALPSASEDDRRVRISALDADERLV